MTSQLTDFDARYLDTWIEPDPATRRTNIEHLWSPGGQLAVSSLGITLTGIDEITTHIAGVHDGLIAGKGLRFSYDQQVESGDALLLRWSMTARNGEVVGRGVDTVFRDAEGKITRAYMFMGVN
ncbi:nuclear transport factor 2 family protein [Leucobacter coleopterorum]|uniref:Nuclear transport factor 2 family protein n=1 Tax=Leucobacter coleopterorum TaxID=2714933 RepID=A0ABX6K1P0_9MICO|nr:nuclear transport factor 2 family protein [Leucobacter coleopterorum]QIM18965.1 nuclear transport factor 2 family protein [Leucobacter coleopterorum]